MTMNWKNTTTRYGTLPIALHWLMLLLLVGVYAAINLHDAAPKESEIRAILKTLHFALGLAVFALVGARLVIRVLAGPAPRTEPAIPRWQHRLAVLVHVALYLFMIGMPLLGWLAVSAKGTPVLFFGAPLPLLIGPDKALYDTLKDLHETIGTLGYWLIGLHAAAALWHHYVRRDDTLVHMLPRLRRPRGRPGGSRV